MAATTPGQRCAQIVRAFLRRPGVTQQGRGFGSTAFKVRGKNVRHALPAGALVVKLPRRRVAALTQAGRGTPFEPGPGPVMKQWLELNAASDQDWASLAEEALAFVAAYQSGGRTQAAQRGGRHGLLLSPVSRCGSACEPSVLT